MRAISVRQPWAWAIMHGGKDVENRSRNIAGSYRGPVAIHAGKAIFEEEGGAYPEVQSAIWLEEGGYVPTGVQLWEVADDVDPHDPRFAYGAIVGVVDLVRVHHADDCEHDDLMRLAGLYRSGPEGRAEVAALPDSGAGGIVGKIRGCSPWAQPDQYHLVLASPRPLAEPIPCRGALGLWTVPDDIVAALPAVTP